MPIATSTALLAAGLATGAGSTVGGIAAAKGSKPQLISTPPPAPMFPDQLKNYMDLLQGGPAKTGGPTTLGFEAKPTTLSYTGGASPTGGVTKLGYDPNVNIKSMMDLLTSQSRRQADIGRANILESFGGAGLRYSEPAARGVAEFEGQRALDLQAQLQQLQLSMEPIRLQAAQAQAGLAEAEKGRALTASENAFARDLEAKVAQGQLSVADANRQLEAAKVQAQLDESGKVRELGVELDWRAQIERLATMFYPTAAIAGGGTSPTLAGVGQGLGSFGQMMMLMEMLKGGKP